ncbi:MAG: alpha/beta hydrolase [Pseudomonadota bacterium]
MRIILVHGAWHGAWCWDAVAQLLRDAGHTVETPTLKGVGERAGELDASVDLNTHIDQLAGMLKADAPALLVGHSYGGAVTLGAADRVPDGVTALVQLDAQQPEPGTTLFDLVPEEARDRRRAEAAASRGGLTFSPGDISKLGLSEELTAEIAPKLTPHPVQTYETPLTLMHPIGAGKPCTYIACTDPPYAPLATHRHRAAALGWPVIELTTGHDAMLSAPAEVAALIHKSTR